MGLSYNLVQSEDTPVGLKASDVRKPGSEVVNEGAGDKPRVIVENSGVPAAGVVTALDLKWLQEPDRRMAKLRETMDGMRQAFRDVPPEEFNRVGDRAVQESRTYPDGPDPRRRRLVPSASGLWRRKPKRKGES